MWAKSIRQVQMSRASRAVRHIEKRPKLPDVNEAPGNDSSSLTSLCLRRNGVLCGSGGAPSSAALHDRQHGYNPHSQGAGVHCKTAAFRAERNAVHVRESADR
jgi:hypothetical protein